MFKISAFTQRTVVTKCDFPLTSSCGLKKSKANNTSPLRHQQNTKLWLWIKSSTLAHFQIGLGRASVHTDPHLIDHPQRHKHALRGSLRNTVVMEGHARQSIMHRGKSENTTIRMQCQATNHTYQQGRKGWLLLLIVLQFGKIMSSFEPLKWENMDPG